MSELGVTVEREQIRGRLMRLLDRLEQHMSLPGDSDTLHKQKVAGLLAGVAGCSFAALLAAVNFVLGLPAVGWLYLAMSLYMLAAIVLLLAFPRFYAPLVFAAALAVTVHPWVVYAATGGFRSGLNPFFWSLFGPVSSLLLIGPMAAMFNAGVLLICAVLAGVFDPTFAAAIPAMPDALRRSISVFNVVAPSMMIFVMGLYLFREVESARARADQLLLNILPAPIAARLKRQPGTIAARYPDVTVLFADIVDFTRLSSGADPTAVVGMLNAIFSDFDDLADFYRLEKIKTIGDAYMVAGGLPQPRPDHVEAVAAFAVEALQLIGRHHAWNGEPIQIRIGINTGPVVAGVIGRKKFIYDLWGDTVNTASRMESNGLANVIQVTAPVRERLAGRYDFEERPPITIKGKGPMVTYLLKN